jgi:hypothetical protein
MTGTGSMTITCPNCGEPVDVELLFDSPALRSVDDPLIVNVSVGNIDHECPPPRGREPLARAA